MCRRPGQQFAGLCLFLVQAFHTSLRMPAFFKSFFGMAKPLENGDESGMGY
jgi:hypothetical protein